MSKKRDIEAEKLDYIEAIPNEMSIDDISFGQVIYTGIDDLNLTGDELRDFMRKCIYSILAKGGVPYDVEEKGDMWRRIQDMRYGTDADAIVDNVMVEWEEKGGEDFKDYPFCDPWFGLLTDEFYKAPNFDHVLKN